MKQYQLKTLAATAADKALRLLVAAALGIGWFVFLWGLSLPALCAGLAMGTLLWLCARLLGKKRLEKREKQTRRMLGGELALDALLMLPPRQAAFQVALWIAPRYPLVAQRTGDWCVIGALDGKRAYLRLVAQHDSVRVTAQQLVEAARETKAQGAELCLLCATAPLEKEANEYLRTSPVELRLIARDELLALAGRCSPATDDDLRRLAQRRKKRRSAKEWGQIVLDPSRARRYWWYGAGMTALAFVTGQWVYPIPAVLCLGLFAACKVRQAKSEAG